MITKAMVEAGYAKEVIRLRDCPEGDEVVCQIGEYWFYFWNGDQGVTLTCAQFKAQHSAEEIVEAIWTQLEEFRRNWDLFCIEYCYYDFLLRESGIEG